MQGSPVGQLAHIGHQLVDTDLHDVAHFSAISSTTRSMSEPLSMIIGRMMTISSVRRTFACLIRTAPPEASSSCRAGLPRHPPQTWSMTPVSLSETSLAMMLSPDAAAPTQEWIAFTAAGPPVSTSIQIIR